MESNTANWRNLNGVVGATCQMTDFIQKVYLVLYMHQQSSSVNVIQNEADNTLNQFNYFTETTSFR